MKRAGHPGEDLSEWPAGRLRRHPVRQPESLFRDRRAAPDARSRRARAGAPPPSARAARHAVRSPRRGVELVRPHPVHADRPVRAVVHRHRRERSKAGQCLGRPCRVQVVVPQVGAPAADRKQRHVHRADGARHALEKPGVPGEVRAGLALDHVTERGGAVRPHRRPASVVARGYGTYPQARDLDRVTGSDLGDPQAQPSQPRHRTRRPRRNDQRRAGREPCERGHVQMVGVQMRDEHGVGHRGPGRRQRTPAPAQMRETAGEERIGQQPYAAVLDRAGGMTPPDDLHRHVALLHRLTSSLTSLDRGPRARGARTEDGRRRTARAKPGSEG